MLTARPLNFALKAKMNEISMDDKEFMNEAFKEAQKAYERGEAPVGALIAQNGNVIARG